MLQGQATIMHADLDAFYASVALLENPVLRGKPVAVGGGVVLSCTYEARAFGVEGGMPLGRARALCPELVVVGGSFRAYTALSDQVFGVFRDFTPLVEPVSIDEAFLDVSGATHIFGSPGDIGSTLRQRVRAETGLPVSVGIARTKHLAKIASRVAKPDGLVVVEPDGEETFLHPLSVDHLWGVGPVTVAKLAEKGIHTVGDLAAAPYRSMTRWLGPGAGGHLHALAWNQDPRSVEIHRRARSVGAQSAFARDDHDHDRWSTILMDLAHRVGWRLRAKGRAGRSVTLRVRFADFTSATRAHSMLTPTASTSVLHRVTHALLDALMEGDDRGLSLLGISVSKLQPASPLQMELPIFPDDHLGGSERELELQALDRNVDGLRERYGKAAVGSAAVLLDPRRSRFAEGLSDIMTREAGSGSDDFQDPTGAEQPVYVEAEHTP